jgi:hypothetical protein
MRGERTKYPRIKITGLNLIFIVESSFINSYSSTP